MDSSPSSPRPPGMPSSGSSTHLDVFDSQSVLRQDEDADHGDADNVRPVVGEGVRAQGAHQGQTSSCCLKGWYPKMESAKSATSSTVASRETQQCCGGT